MMTRVVRQELGDKICKGEGVQSSHSMWFNNATPCYRTLWMVDTQEEMYKYMKTKYVKRVDYQDITLLKVSPSQAELERYTSLC